MLPLLNQIRAFYNKPHCIVKIEHSAAKECCIFAHTRPIKKSGLKSSEKDEASTEDDDDEAFLLADLLSLLKIAADDKQSRLCVFVRLVEPAVIAKI